MCEVCEMRADTKKHIEICIDEAETQIKDCHRQIEHYRELELWLQGKIREYNRQLKEP